MRRIANQDREDDDYQNQAEEWREAIKPDASDVGRRRIGGYVSGHQCRSDLFRKGRRAMTEYTAILEWDNGKNTTPVPVTSRDDTEPGAIATGCDHTS